MKPRIFSVLIVSLLLVIPIIGTAHSEQGYIWIRTVTMLVPAVAETPQGYVGVASKLVVSVAYPGHGIVYFAAEPLTQLDTQAAARIAAIVASILAGADFYSYDYFIHLKANSTIVGGPSASGAMAVAILAALRGKTIPSNFSMTGMVDPDITLGPVGGIPEKLEAMARNGIKVFVIPAGQSIALDLNTGRYVNVTALGKALGVKVIEADTILDAYIAATHDEELLTHIEKLLNKKTNIYKDFPLLKENLLGVIKTFKKQGNANLTCAQKLVDQLDPAIKGFVQRLIKEAKEYLVEEKRLEQQGLFYSAASRAFAAAIDSSIACSVASSFSSNDVLGSLRNQAQRYINASNSIIMEAKNSLKKVLSKSLNVVELQLAIATENRIDSANSAISEAKYYVRVANQTTGFGKVEALLNAVQSAVYAYYRAITVKQWLELLSLAKSVHSINIDKKRIAGLAENYYYIASSAATYLQALASSAGLVVSPPSQLTEASKILARGTLQHNVTAALRVLAISITSLSNTATTIHKVFNTNTEKTLRASRKALTILTGLDEANNATPILPALYAEYASIQQDIETQLSLYMQAASYAILLGALTQHRHQGQVIATKTTPSTTETVTKTVTRTKTSTTTQTKTLVKTITKSIPTTITMTKTKTLTKTQPLTSYISSLLIAVIIGVAIGYIVGRSRPL